MVSGGCTDTEIEYSKECLINSQGESPMIEKQELEEEGRSAIGDKKPTLNLTNVEKK